MDEKSTSTTTAIAAYKKCPQAVPAWAKPGVKVKNAVGAIGKIDSNNPLTIAWDSSPGKPVTVEDFYGISQLPVATTAEPKPATTAAPVAPVNPCAPAVPATPVPTTTTKVAAPANPCGIVAPSAPIITGVKFSDRESASKKRDQEQGLAIRIQRWAPEWLPNAAWFGIPILLAFVVVVRGTRRTQVREHSMSARSTGRSVLEDTADQLVPLTGGRGRHVHPVDAENGDYNDHEAGGIE